MTGPVRHCAPRGHRAGLRLATAVAALALAGAGTTVALAGGGTTTASGAAAAAPTPGTVTPGTTSLPTTTPSDPGATAAAPDVATGDPAVEVGQRDPAPARPVRVRVAAIGVDSSLVPLGLQADGSLEVPATGFPAGWYTGGPVPGATGPAVLAGHVDWAGAPGVFSDLARTAVGDVITVTDERGTETSFRVSAVGRYPKTQFPTAAVYGDVDHPALRLVTCGGDFDSAARSYVDDVVVFADAV